MLSQHSCFHPFPSSMFRCVASYERRTCDVRNLPTYREEKEVSLEDTHPSPNKCLRRQRRRECMHLDDIPERIAQMKKKVKNFVELTLRDGKGQFAAPPLSRDFPPLVNRLFAYVLPPSSLFPSVSRRPSLALQPSPPNTSDNDCLLCQQFLRAKRAIHRKPQSSTDEVLMAGLHAALEQYVGRRKGEQTSSLSTSADLRQEERSGDPSLDSRLSKPSNRCIEPSAVSSPMDPLSHLEQAGNSLPVLSHQGRRRRLRQLLSETSNRFNEEFYTLDHIQYTPSPEDYPTQDYRTGSCHLDPTIMSETLQKWANEFALSERQSVCHSLGDFPCGEDLRTSLDSSGGSKSESEVLTASGAVSATNGDNSNWDPYLQVPHVSLVNHCHISSLTDQLSSITFYDDFVPVVDASVFSDSFLAFNEEVPMAPLRRVPEGALFELGPLTPALRDAEDVDGGIAEEALFYMVTLLGAPSSPVATTTVSGEAPWQLLLTNNSIKVYRRPIPGVSVFQYKGECQLGKVVFPSVVELKFVRFLLNSLYDDEC